MLTFRMDETNFDEGQQDGVRIVTGAGLKVDFDEFLADGSALGLWHLHNGACQGEGTGLADASGGGHSLVNHGAAPVEDGYQFVRTENDYMTAAFAGQPARSALTLECWVRGWAVPNNTSGYLADYYRNADNRLYLYATRAIGGGAESQIAAFAKGGGVSMGYLWWQGTAVTALLDSGAPWHVAAVLDGSAWRLFVNGVLRHQRSTGQALAAGNYTLYFGANAGPANHVSAVLDEARLSASGRYAANFAPHRLLAAGTYESPTFDALRVQADWLDLVSEAEVPAGCGIGWEVRAADETDAFGRPQALWEAYAGAPEALPDGRYFQWRATLGASADRFASPTLVSVEAQASEAGYDLYGGAGAGPETIDYSVPIARVGPSVREIQTDPLAAGAVHWFGLRPVDGRGVESPVTQSEGRLELAASGARVPDRPAGVLDLVADPLPQGAVRLVWQYRPGVSGVVPQTFLIFGDGGGGEIHYGLSLGEVLYQEGRTAYAATVEGLAGGVEHQLAVRAVAAGDVWDEQPAVTTVTPDADAPGAVTALEAEVVL